MTMLSARAFGSVSYERPYVKTTLRTRGLGAGLRRLLYSAALLAAVGCETPSWSGIDTLTGGPLRLVPTRASVPVLTGVYRSARLGTLQLWQAGAHVHGRFELGAGPGRVIGALDGTLQDDLLRYRWIEKRGRCDAPRSAHGHGYFFYLSTSRLEPFTRLVGERDYLVPTPQPAHLPQLGTRSDGTITALRVSANPDTDSPAAVGCEGA
jgi:hypothetical protein